jgi:HD-GYP domain-containing protein (c-di-GMP phosphodiesterase class II)
VTEITGPSPSSQPTSGSGVRLGELIAALSLATDLAMGQPLEHALRTCLLGVYLGERLGLNDADLSDVFYVALLRSVGCTGDPYSLAAIFGDEIATQADFAAMDPGDAGALLGYILRHAGQREPPLRRAGTLAAALTTGPQQAREGAVTHCEVAQFLADRLGLGPGVKVALGHVFERWDGKGLSRRVKGEAIALPMRIVHVVRDAEVLHRLGGVAAAVAVTRERAGTAYDPAIAERFASAAAELLARLDVQPTWDALLAAEPGAPRWLTEAEVDNATRVMGDFADLKCWYTGGHSAAVADLAAEAATRLGLPPADVVAVRRAGWLHDLGRTGISVRIWIKPGPLTLAEWERVRLHPYLTERVLARPRALAQLGALAGLHHERMDGSGYHRGAGAALLPPAARVLAAADAFHAMLEPRPQRAPLTPDQAAEMLIREVRAGKLDGEAGRAVLAATGHKAGRARRTWAAGLSEREVEVLRLMARGLSRREMSQRLSISERTAAHHVQHVYDKIGVSTRAAATLFAMQHDLLA